MAHCVSLAPENSAHLHTTAEPCARRLFWSRRSMQQFLSRPKPQPERPLRSRIGKCKISSARFHSDHFLIAPIAFLHASQWTQTLSYQTSPNSTIKSELVRTSKFSTILPNQLPDPLGTDSHSDFVVPCNKITNNDKNFLFFLPTSSDKVHVVLVAAVLSNMHPGPQPVPIDWNCS
jgi:hypothetical protein